MKVNSINGLLGFNNTDLFKLADEIDTLELKYKETIISYGNALDKDNVITDIVLQETPQDLKSICDEVILNSQQIVDSGSSVYVTNTGLVTEDSSNTEVIVGGAVGDNLSAGTRAWVDGHYIVGNGADNNAYYNKGFVDGKASVSTDAQISYVYHTCTTNCYRRCTGFYLNHHPRWQGQCDPGYWQDCWDCSNGCGDYTGSYASYNTQCLNTIKICGKISGVTIEKAIIVFK